VEIEMIILFLMLILSLIFLTLSIYAAYLLLTNLIPLFGVSSLIQRFILGFLTFRKTSCRDFEEEIRKIPGNKEIMKSFKLLFMSVVFMVIFCYFAVSIGGSV
jgi:hypothetical protein